MSLRVAIRFVTGCYMIICRWGLSLGSCLLPVFAVVRFAISMPSAVRVDTRLPASLPCMLVKEHDVTIIAVL